MKTLRSVSALTLLTAATCFALIGCASRDRSMDSASAGSYPLTKCVVSGEDLGDKPYVFTHEGQEVKLCCKDCLKDFKKDTAKYTKKIADAEKAK